MQSTNWVRLIAGLASVIKLGLQPFGIEVPDEHINDILNLVAAIIAPLAVYINHRTHKTVITEEVVKAVQQAPRTFQEMVPVATDVHTKINLMYAEIKSGKLTDATQDAVQLYLKIQELLKQYNAPEEKKGA